MDEATRSKIKDYVTHYTPYIFYGAEVAFMQQAISVRYLAALKAMHSNSEYRMQVWKQQLIEKDLNKPFFQKFYEMSGRGY